MARTQGPIEPAYVVDKNGNKRMVCDSECYNYSGDGCLITDCPETECAPWCWNELERLRKLASVNSRSRLK